MSASAPPSSALFFFRPPLFFNRLFWTFDHLSSTNFVGFNERLRPAGEFCGTTRREPEVFVSFDLPNLNRAAVS